MPNCVIYGSMQSGPFDPMQSGARSWHCENSPNEIIRKLFYKILGQVIYFLGGICILIRHIYSENNY